MFWNGSEVQQKSHFLPGRLQVTQDLPSVSIDQTLSCFDFDENPVFDNEIESECTDTNPTVHDVDGHFAHKGNFQTLQFYSKGVATDFLGVSKANTPIRAEEGLEYARCESTLYEHCRVRSVRVVRDWLFRTV
jgi:hypothetical protein